MSKGRIELQGVDELLADIRKRLGNGAARLENRGLRKAGQPIAEAMKTHINRSNQAPHLRDDIRVSGVRRKDGKRYVLIGAGKKTGWRGHFLEFGTVKMAPKPWAGPGFEEGKGQAIQTLVEEYRGGIEQK